MKKFAVLLGSIAILAGHGFGCGSDDESGSKKASGGSGGGGKGGTGGKGGADASTGGAGASGSGGGGVGGSGGGAGDASTSCTNPTSDVTLKPGDDIQAAVDQNPEGTKFLLAAGVHRMQQVEPKANDEFYGELSPTCERLTTMTGARVLTSFTQQGNAWVATGQDQSGQVHGDCETGWEQCKYPEDLFVDDKLYQHVATAGEVGPGKWHFDYGADTVYVGDDPNGHVVEIGVTRVAFSPSASGVRVQSLIVEKYAIPAQMGAIGDQYPKDGWHVENNEVRFNHGTGINLSSNSVATGNYVHDNGQKGIGAGGDNVLYEKNEVARNNIAHFDAGWEAGGSKFSGTTGLVVRKNCVHDNFGPGLWTDIDNKDVLYEGNVVFGNVSMGIFHEISFAAVIRNNFVGQNGKEFAWLYGSQILVSTSQDADVYGNTVEVAESFGNGISVIWQDRPPHQATGNKLHDNDVTFLGDGPVWQNEVAQTGVAADFSPATTDAFTKNSMDANTYHLKNTSAHHFSWNNGARTFSELQAAGQEKTGKIDTQVTPKSWSCALVTP